MKPETKFNLLLSLAMVVGLGGFLVLIGVVLPAFKPGDIMGPLSILIWAAIVIAILVIRYRVAKKDAEIQAEIKKDAAKYAKVQAKKKEIKDARRKARNPMLVDPDDEEEDVAAPSDDEEE